MIALPRSTSDLRKGCRTEHQHTRSSMPLAKYVEDFALANESIATFRETVAA